MNSIKKIHVGPNNWVISRIPLIQRGLSWAYVKKIRTNSASNLEILCVAERNLLDLLRFNEITKAGLETTHDDNDILRIYPPPYILWNTRLIMQIVLNIFQKASWDRIKAVTAFFTSWFSFIVVLFVLIQAIGQ